MQRRLLLVLALGLVLTALAFFAAPTQLVFAATNVTVTPSAMNGWFFYDDGFTGGIGNMTTGPATPPLGTGSVHLATPGSSRFNITTQNFAGTRFSDITNLAYSTYRSSVDVDNNLAITLQFDTDYDMNDTTTTWQGRVTFEPYFTSPNGVFQNTWQSWTPMAGNWWMSGNPIVNNVAVTQHCPQMSPCSWTQLKAYYPNAGIRRSIGWVHLRAGGPTPGFDGNADALTIGVTGNDTTYNFENGNAGIAFVPETSYVQVGNNTTVFVNVNSATNLYGYQFQVNYDTSKVGVVTSGFINTWFNTVSPAGSVAPSPWNGTCSAGVCKFAATLLSPSTPLTGSGTVAFITFSGSAAGIGALSFGPGSILTDRDAIAIAHGDGTGSIHVYGTSTVSGTVTLQGRATPIDAGTVTIVDQGGVFPQQIVAFDAVTGNWSATVAAEPGGTLYNLTASHTLYLSNLYTGLNVLPSTPVTPLPNPTKLLGGDANNSGKIDLSDLTCIGNAFGGLPTDCGGVGSTDINLDGTVNILDLVLVGGNYDLQGPRPW